MATTNPASALVEATCKGLKEPLGKALAVPLLENAPPEDLLGWPPETLARLVAERLAFLRERKPGRVKIAVTNPTGDFGEFTTVDIVNDDMPFLVDSTIGLLAERGVEVTLALHPVLSVKRDAAGALLDIAAKPGTDGSTIRESFIHIHLVRISAVEAASLETDLRAMFADVRLVVIDWRAMQQRMREAISRYQRDPPPIAIEEFTEAIAFLQWLLDNHFTFLGMREYRFVGGAAQGRLEPVPETGLGVLRNSAIEEVRGASAAQLPPQIREFLRQPAPIIITKADLRANVHRRAAMDYVGVKLFDSEGELSGELRAIGLFTSSAYTQNPNDIPLLRRKLNRVVQASGFSPFGHSGKALISVLESLPRDELFQIDSETLETIAHGILRLEERPRTRLFVRRDKFDRFVSAFAFIPRDRFDSDVRRRVGEILADAYGGRVTSFKPSFGEGTLVRVHFIVTRTDGGDASTDLAEIEQKVVAAVRSWDDRLESALLAKGSSADRVARWLGAFHPGYRDATEPDDAIKDIVEIEALGDSDEVGVEFLREAGDGARQLHCRIYHRGEAIALGLRLPILENLGLRAISETTHMLSPAGTAGRGRAFIHDVLLSAPIETAIEPPVLRGLETAFRAVWTGLAEDDALNSLVLAKGMAWKEVALLRAFGRYIRQSAVSYSNEYMAQTLVKHAEIARLLVRLFFVLFDPGVRDEAKAKNLRDDIEAALTQVPNLDEDRIVRRHENLVSSILRTNYFQKDKSDGAPPVISFKIDSKKVDGLPDPKPFAEIFVYAPDVEGVHLRGGPIARGGIRWSDRPEDFRTEVLGLAKAQSVKNAVIVPVGAKGGFVPKRFRSGDSREQIQAEGIRTYKRFISSLLDLTDNLKGTSVVPPEATVRRDEDDPYLVVAADKGTATFSDTANGISQSHGFWLDDAFASGGSAGYDHKKMGITARGAWEAVKRHFREMDVDIQNQPFSVIGVGDMSGDVFGNGMLLSRQIRLLAAFDHRDIFIDPAPDAERAVIERERLFALPRSSWQDYDKSLISAGGGIFPRHLKAIPLSAEMKALTGLVKATATPQEIMHALLLAPADLLWFGGIGTYVKSSAEHNADAGDRANDAIRTDADELRVKVIGEGANLGITQKARIEFALKGGRINTDAIDNSAGVNSSDIEVNIKIGLSRAEAQGRLTRAARNVFLAAMTDEVAGLVLRNNYLQTQCLSVALAQGTAENSYALQLMSRLERRGQLDRKLEALPSDAVIVERDLRGGGLTRPELAVLLAYAKIALRSEIVASGVPDDPYLSRELRRYFPKAMQERFGEDIDHHRLRREIIATMLSNGMINRGGPGFVALIAGETAAKSSDIAMAYAVARDSFGFLDIAAGIDALDARIPGGLQNALYAEMQRHLRGATVWFLRHEKLADGLEELIGRYRSGLEAVEAALPEAVPPADLDAMAKRMSELAAAGVPAATAARIARQRFLARAPDVVKIAGESGAGIPAVAAALYGSAAELGIEGLADEGRQLKARDLLERQAINRLTAQLFATHRGIVAGIVAGEGGLAGWRDRNGELLATVTGTIETTLASKPFDIARLAVAQGTLADLTGR
ncbi:MAG: NAD-glutamate dehydrogenase [Hyphomicrobiales bacterium]